MGAGEVTALIPSEMVLAQFHLSTIFMSYPRGIGFAFHRAGMEGAARRAMAKLRKCVSGGNVYPGYFDRLTDGSQ